MRPSSRRASPRTRQINCPASAVAVPGSPFGALPRLPPSTISGSASIVQKAPAGCSGA